MKTKVFPKTSFKIPETQQAQLRSKRQFCLSVVLLEGCTFIYVKSTCSLLSLHPHCCVCAAFHVFSASFRIYRYTSKSSNLALTNLNIPRITIKPSLRKRRWFFFYQLCCWSSAWFPLCSCDKVMNKRWAWSHETPLWTTTNKFP